MTNRNELYVVDWQVDKTSDEYMNNIYATLSEKHAIAGDHQLAIMYAGKIKRNEENKRPSTTNR